LVCRRDGISESFFDAGGRIDEHDVKICAQVAAQLDNLSLVHGVLFTPLGCREQVQPGQSFVSDERLTQADTPFDDVDDVVDDAILQT
jgi:hypothetical protein